MCRLATPYGTLHIREHPTVAGKGQDQFFGRTCKHDFDYENSEESLDLGTWKRPS